MGEVTGALNLARGRSHGQVQGDLGEEFNPKRSPGAYPRGLKVSRREPEVRQLRR